MTVNENDDSVHPEAIFCGGPGRGRGIGIPAFGIFQKTCETASAGPRRNASAQTMSQFRPFHSIDKFAPTHLRACPRGRWALTLLACNCRRANQSVIADRIAPPSGRWTRTAVLKPACSPGSVNEVFSPLQSPNL